MYLRKISITTLALFALLLLYLMPSNKDEKEINLKNDNVEYIFDNTKEVIYLLDKDDYIARTTISSVDSTPESIAKDLTQGLIIDGEKSNIIPNGFKSIIPSGTQILNVELKDKILTINFSKELLDIDKKYEEKMIEAITYTLTSIDGIDKITIQVEGKNLEELPNSKKNLPTVLDKNYGINKEYDLTSTMNIDSYTLYYVSNYNDNIYYVPVTKYINNNNQDKVKVIIDELSTSPIYQTNLMSYLNSNTSLIDYDYNEGVMKLNFNNAILNDNSNKILEEVIYSISLSLDSIYNVREVDFIVDNKEIYKNSIKNLE